MQPSVRFTKRGVYIGLRRVAYPIQYKAIGTRLWDDTSVAEIEFQDSDGALIVERFNLSEFLPRNRHRVIEKLTDRRYQWPSQVTPANLLGELIKQPPGKKFTIVNAPGWHEGSYVTALWSATIPGKPRKMFQLDPNSGAHLASFTLGKGSLKLWKETVAAVAKKSAPLRLFIAAGFAAPLLRPLNIDSFGLNLFGLTSQGKSTCGFAAASIAGIIRDRTLPSWADLGPAIEQMSVGHRDGVLPLEETADFEGQQISPEKKARMLAFAIARNRPRNLDRMYQKTSNLTTRDYRIIVLSSSERSLGDIAQRAGNQRLPGEEVRLIDIPCEGRQGIFDENIKPALARDIVDQLKINAEANQGFALRRFMKRLQKDDNAISELKKYMNHYESSTMSNGTDRAHMRMGGNFAVLYAAAALAIDYEILPWKKEGALRAISVCMDGAFDLLAGSGADVASNSTSRALLQSLRTALARLNLVKVVKRKRLGPGETELRDQADGFDFGTEIYVKPTRWKAIGDENRKALIRLGVLKTERKDTATVARKLNGMKKKQRYHVIDMAVLRSLLSST